MKYNKYNKYNAWTVALVSAGVVSLPAAARAEETATTNSVLTALSTTTISGYVDTSIHWNPGTGNANTPVYSPNGAPGALKADGFNLNVIALTISKPTGEGDWAAGYNATLLFGPDAVGYNTSPGAANSDFSLKDTYVDLHAPLGNGIDLKLGTFTEILGYEVYETGNNPNYTRSYGYEIEPTALTGLLATYQVTPSIAAQGGIANTWSAGVNRRATPPEAESFKTYLGGLTLTAPKSFGFLEGSTLFGGIINGYDVNAQGIKTSWYVGGTLKTPLKCVTLGLAYDYVNLANNVTFDANNNPMPHKSGYQSAAAAYLLWQVADKLTLNTRVDYLSQSAYLATPGLPRDAFALTETLQYELWKNVISRLEFRWDHSLSGNDTYGGEIRGAPNSENALLVAANIIYKF
jgi:hypothetical protein